MSSMHSWKMATERRVRINVAQHTKDVIDSTCDVPCFVPRREKLCTLFPRLPMSMARPHCKWSRHCPVAFYNHMPSVYHTHGQTRTSRSNNYSLVAILSLSLSPPMRASTHNASRAWSNNTVGSNVSVDAVRARSTMLRISF